jgi:hypothetical protein
MTTAQLTRLAQFGTLWRPATAAYGSPPGLYVNCDHCKATRLPACFHDGTLDLCLPCAHHLLAHGAAPAPAVGITPAPVPALQDPDGVVRAFESGDVVRYLSANSDRYHPAFVDSARRHQAFGAAALDPYLESATIKGYGGRATQTKGAAEDLYGTEDVSVDSADFDADVFARPMAVGMR